MGVNKNLLNFSGLIKPTSLLQSSRCFRQKNFLFLYRWVLRFCPSWQKFILSSGFQGFALLRLLLHLAAPCNSETPFSCRKNSKPRWQGKIWPDSVHEVNPAWEPCDIAKQSIPLNKEWAKANQLIEARANQGHRPPRSTGEARKNPEKGTRQALHSQLLPPLVLPSGAQRPELQVFHGFFNLSFFQQAYHPQHFLPPCISPPRRIVGNIIVILSFELSRPMPYKTNICL